MNSSPASCAVCAGAPEGDPTESVAGEGSGARFLDWKRLRAGEPHVLKLRLRLPHSGKPLHAVGDRERERESDKERGWEWQREREGR